MRVNGFSELICGFLVLDYHLKIKNMENKKYEAGSINVAKIKESIKTIEMLTSQYKKRRMSTENYIKLVHENLSNLTSQRNYNEYLNNIGQN